VIWVWIVGIVCYLMAMRLLKGPERIWAAIVLGLALVVATWALVYDPGSGIHFDGAMVGWV
jgi:hypothetical protein